MKPADAIDPYELAALRRSVRFYQSECERLQRQLAEAQQREVWWREWYILGEMARMIGGAMPEVVERAKELRRILDATGGEK